MFDYYKHTIKILENKGEIKKGTYREIAGKEKKETVKELRKQLLNINK